VCPTERFRIDGVAIPQDAYLDVFWDTLDILQRGEGVPPSPEANTSAPIPSRLPGFNFLTLLALRLFLKAKVDVMILEVGVGGLLCTTNTFPEDRVLASGITTLDFDHCALLGGTLAAIAGQKAGIIRPGVPAVAAPARSDAETVILQTAKTMRAPLWWSDETVLASQCPGGVFPALGLAGRFQKCNAATAVALSQLALLRAASGHVAWPPWNLRAQTIVKEAIRGMPVLSPMGFLESDGGILGVKEIKDAKDVTVVPTWVLEGLKNVNWPGRAQKFLLPNAKGTIYMDGAHTEKSMGEVTLWYLGANRTQGMAAATATASCSEAYKAVDKGHKRVLIFFAGRDKDVLSLLLPLSLVQWDAVHFVSVPGTPMPPSPGEDSLLRELLGTFLERKAAGSNGTASEQIWEDAGKTCDLNGILERGSELSGWVINGKDPLPPHSEQWLRALGRAWEVVLEEGQKGKSLEKHRSKWVKWIESADETYEQDLACKTYPLPALSSSQLNTSFANAMENVLKVEGSVSVLVTGSLYLVGSALEFFRPVPS